MNEFLDLNEPLKFKEIFTKNISEPGEREKIDFQTARGRVLAEDIRSPVNLPPFTRSTVDGYAVKATDTAGATPSLPVYLEIKGEVEMGKKIDLELKPGQAIKIPTGGMMPSGADAALMIEYTEKVTEELIESSRAVAKGENVVGRGEDIGSGDLLLPAGSVLRPQDIGALAGLGITEVLVYSRPEVAVISTGDEIVAPDREPAPGQIRDINSYALSSLLTETGVKARHCGIVSDTFSGLKEKIQENLDADLVLISGGSSVGVKDMTVDILNSLGEPGVLLHGVAIKPGKPTILAFIDQTPVIGLPGHPASSWIIAEVLLKPLLRILRGERGNKFFPAVEGKLTRNLDSDKGREEYIPVRIEQQPEQLFFHPLTGKSSLITTLVEADGLIKIAAGREGFDKDEKIKAVLFAQIRD